MINKTSIEESPIGNLAQVQNNVMTNMRCHTFAKVIAVYVDGKNEQQTDEYGNTYNIKRAKNTIDVEPIVQESRQKYNINNKKVEETYYHISKICNIPYITSWKPEVGDYCVLLHLDRSIKSLVLGITTDSQLKSNQNLHDLNDCVAIGPFGPFK
jgi:hypothetical protein|nr:MAG TPA: hypothetical protein [Caudoviricetes sp.]